MNKPYLCSHTSPYLFALFIPVRIIPLREEIQNDIQTVNPNENTVSPSVWQGLLGLFSRCAGDTYIAVCRPRGRYSRL